MVARNTGGVFLNTFPLHDKASTRIRWESFMGCNVPFLACTDLAIFKAFFNRTKHWADLEEMALAGTLDFTEVLGTLIEHLGPDDARISRLSELARN